ncbi:MAG: hypothetical protein KGR48_06615 [Alphaproteobacteria bacterium]|nr:hypothetical protein [Alphaproteobacteria bacterium]MDE2012447.1 hypothetical protein [Alphaproteobacteria bacterium]MDE2072085.1 hypothetical protein [Alphaproteobacteria bacterium]MDE2352791.1 hypothetical protein [Alphaproteobacteria bacterium]
MRQTNGVHRHLRIVANLWRQFAVKNNRRNPLGFWQTELHFVASHAPKSSICRRAANGGGENDKELAGNIKPRAVARERELVRGVMQSPKKHQV